MDTAEQEQVFRLAYTDARAALDRQETALEKLQTRAAGVLAAGAVVLGLPTAATTNDATAVAIAFFGGLVVGITAVLWPADWRFTLGVFDVINRTDAGATSLNKELRDGAVQMQRNWRHNRARLVWRYDLYAYACVRLFLEGVFVFVPRL